MEGSLPREGRKQCQISIFWGYYKSQERQKKKKKTEVTAQKLTEKQSTTHTNSDSRMPELMGKVLSFGKEERASFLLQTFISFSSITPNLSNPFIMQN